MISMVLHQIQSPQSTFKRGWEIESERRLWRPTEIHWNTLSQKVDLRDNLKYNVVSQVLNQRILTFWQRRDLHFGKRDNGNPKYASAYGESVCLVLKKSIFGAFWCVAFLYISIILSSPPLFEETSTISRNSESESPALDSFSAARRKEPPSRMKSLRCRWGNRWLGSSQKIENGLQGASSMITMIIYDKGMQRWANFIISSLNPPSS